MGASLRIRVGPDVDDTEWGRLLEQDPRSHPLQRPSVLRAAARCHPGSRAEWIELRDDDGLRAGIGYVVRERLGMRIVVSGLSGLYGGGVSADPAAEAELAIAFERHCAWRTLHRELVWARTEAPVGRWSGIRPLDAAVLDIDAAESFDNFLMTVFPKNRRNEGNRSDRRGLRVDVHEDAHALEAFYPLYVERSSQWQVPPVPLAFLQGLVEDHEEVRVFVASDADGDVIGAHVCIDMGDELFAWVGTTARLKELFPSTVLIREEARWCHLHGKPRLNLGSSIGRAGVGDYKRLLGARSDPRWIVDVDRRPWRRGAR